MSKKSKKQDVSKEDKVSMLVCKLLTGLVAFTMLLGLYFLIYGLLIEPNLPNHYYGAGDWKDLQLAIMSFGLSVIFAALAIRIDKNIGYNP